MTDPYLGDPPSNPADDWFPISPDDAADLAQVPRAIHVGGNGGAVVCRNRRGVEATFWLEQGSILPIRPVRILATGTTATGLVGLA